MLTQTFTYVLKLSITDVLKPDRRRMRENAVREKGKTFALRIVKMYRYLCREF